MKISRMLEIIIILLNRRSVTADELAERFEVSKRTIYRDIDVLSGSGIPIYTTQGYGGGITLMDDYTINRTLLNETDINNMLFALKSLQYTKHPDIDQALEKLGSLFKEVPANDWISINFSPWSSDPNSNNKFNNIKQAILKSNVVEIDYINSNNIKTTREIEPIKMEFLYNSWYIYGWCRLKEDYRTFRMSRIKSLKLTDTVFDKNTARIPRTPDSADENKRQSPWVHLVLQFTEKALYKLYDDYDIHQICDNGDGTYTLTVDFPEDDWVYGYILSFGTNVKVIEPQYMKDIIKDKLKAMLTFYE